MGLMCVWGLGYVVYIYDACKNMMYACIYIYIYDIFVCCMSISVLKRDTRWIDGDYKRYDIIQ